MVRHVLGIACALVACSRASDQNETKMLQDQVPPAKIEVPDGLTIAVAVDGSDRAPITTTTLRDTKPDFANEERRAWLIPALIGGAPAGAIVEASSPTGVSIKITHPTTDGLEPVLILTRRGDVLVSALDPKDPFPRYHGQGGRLHRPGDGQPRLSPVARLAVSTRSSADH